MEELLAEIIGIIPAQYTVYVTFVCAGCALIASFWKAPDEKANAFVRFVYKVVNILGMNVGKAKNADDAEKEKKTLVIGK